MKIYIVIDQTEIPIDSIVGAYTSSDIIPSNIKYNIKSRNRRTHRKKIRQKYGFNTFIFQ